MGQHTPRIGFRGTVFSVWPRLKRWVEQLRPSTTTGREVLTPSRPWGHPQFLFYFGLHLHYIHSESPFILSHFWLTVNRWEWISKMLPPSMISWRTCAGRNLCGLVLVWWCWAAYYSAPVPRGRQLSFALPEEVPRWGNDMDLFACILINYIVYLSIYILIYYDLFVYLFIYLFTT